MNYVILHVLNTHNQVTDQAGIVRNFNIQRIFNGTNAGHRMNSSANTTKTLSKMVGITRIAPFEDSLNATKSGRGTPSINYLSVLNLRLDAQMPLNAGNRINYEFPGHCIIPPSLLYRLP